MPIYEVGTSRGVLGRFGPVLPIEISLPQTLMDYLTSRGEPIPPSVSGNALVDTGASITVVDSDVISRLKISPVGVARIQTAAGQVNQNLFPARFKLPHLVIDFEAVAGADLRPHGIVALIGRDILSRFVFIYLGGSGRIILCF